MIRLLFADDHAIVRAALVQALSAHEDMHVVAQAANAPDTLEQAAALQVEAIVLDLNMPGARGVSLLEALRELRPEVPVLVLSMHNEAPIVERVLRAGAAGYVAKDSQLEVLLQAIREVAAGHRFVDPDIQGAGIAAALAAPGETDVLSARERQVLDLIAAGLRLGAIAERLHVSAKTVSTHKMRLMHKLRISNNADLVRHALTLGPAAPLQDPPAPPAV